MFEQEEEGEERRKAKLSTELERITRRQTKESLRVKRYILTINVPLFKKLRDIIFFVGQ